jgi:hypothetical protein
VFISNRIAIAGLAFLAVAMSGSLLLVATKLFGIPAGILAVTLAALPFAILWFAMPLARRRTLDGGQRSTSNPAPRGSRNSDSSL